MNYDIESRLNTVKTTPMTETEKNMLWHKIELKINEGTTFGTLRFRLRAAVALVLAVLFAGSSVAFAYADTAKPGDVLFPLGVAREKVEIFLAPQSKKNELRVKFAEKRIEDGQVFLSLLVNAKGTLATTFAGSAATTTSGGTSATTTATTIPPTTIATTTSNGATDDATRHFNATIAYLQGVRAELLKNGDGVAANALERAIDAMVAQAHDVPTDRSSVLVKIKDNANKFKMDIRIANGTTTERIAFEEKNKEHGNGKKNHGEDDNNDNRNGTTTAAAKETFITKFFHKEKKDERKNEHEDGDDNRGRGNREDRGDDEHGHGQRGRGHDGFFGKKTNICHIPQGNASAQQTISISNEAVQAHLAHGDHVGACVNGTATTTPDTTAPIISALSASAITTGSATVSWTTNELATGKMKYATTSPLSNVLENTALSLSHSFNLIGLTASSTYHYIVSSADGAGNTASSSELTFTTN